MGRWNAWTSVSINRRIFAASLTVGALTFLVHVGTAAKELVVAYQFGTTDVIDAFLIAFLLPSFLISVVAGSLPSAVIPTYLEVQHREGREAAEQLYAGVMGWSLVLLVGISSMMAFLAPVLLAVLGSGFGEEKLALTRSLYFAVMPILTLKGLATVWTTRLNARDQFAFASAVPILTPIVTVSALLYGAGQWGIYALAAGTVGGALLEAVIIGWYLHTLKITLVPRWSGWSPDLGQVMKQYGPGVAGALFMASTILVDQAMAAMLGPGSVSALSYGGKVVSFALAVGATALGTAVLPHFSRMVAAADWEGVRHTLRTYVTLILKVTIPLTLSAVLLSEWIVGVIFQRGAFTTTDTHIVGQVQAFLLLQVPLYMAGTIVVRLISALKANHILMWGCVLNFIVNIVLNYMFMQWLDVVGIALATFLVYVISVTFLSYMLVGVLKDRQRNQ
ncbi:MAG: virulence factor MviN [Chloroflexi bacterium]|nr:MAG: virulence factor MviN [Chloroflexota bacterium]